MLVVNLFAGPGAGKSTFATRLYSELKVAGYNAEYVSEYAKDLVWADALVDLSDQLFITAKQNQKLRRLKGKVDIAVCDSPLLLGVHYAGPHYLGGTYTKLVTELFGSYQNLNIFLDRNNQYSEHGRTQTEAEALAIDAHLLALLQEEQIPYVHVKSCMTRIDDVVKMVLSQL